MKTKTFALCALALHFAIFFGNAAVSAQQPGTGIRLRRAVRRHLHWHHGPVIRPILRPTTTVTTPVLFALPTQTIARPAQSLIVSPGVSSTGVTSAMPGWAVVAKTQRLVPTTGTTTSALFLTTPSY